MNPGQWGDQLHAILFDTDDVHGTITHTLFGQMGEADMPHRSARSMRRELKRKWRSAGTLREPMYKRLIRKLVSVLEETEKE